MKNIIIEKPLHQLIISLFIIVISIIIFTGLGFGFFYLFESDIQPGLFNPNPDLSNPSQIMVLKYLQTVYAVAIFIISPLIIAWLFSQKPLEYLGYSKNPGFRVVMIAVCCILISVPAINALGKINSMLSLPSFLSSVENWMRAAEDSATNLTVAFLKTQSTGGIIANVFIMALIPAFGEEMLFRGVFQRIFITWTKSAHWGIWIAAILFSGLHSQFFTFLPRFGIGLMLGYMFVWTGSLWVPIIVHFINNASVIALSNSSGQQKETIFDTMGTTPETWGYVLVSLMGLVVLLYLLKEAPHLPSKKNIS